MTITLEFPNFLHGTVSNLRRKVKGVAQTWAKSYREQQCFPEPALGQVLPGSTIFLKLGSDLFHERAEWRLYFVQILVGSICEELEWIDHGRVSATFEAATMVSPWGALDAAVEHIAPNTRIAVVRRLEAVLSFWEPLGQLRYVDRAAQPVGIETVLENHYSGLLDMWLKSRSLDVREDLLQAVNAMKWASPEEVRQRLIESLARTAKNDPRLRNTEKLSDLSWLGAAVSGIGSDVYEGLTGGHVSDLLRVLFLMLEGQISEKR